MYGGKSIAPFIFNLSSTGHCELFHAILDLIRPGKKFRDVLKRRLFRHQNRMGGF